MTVLVLCMLLLLVLGVPIGYAIGISSLAYVVLVSDMSALVVVQQISSGADTMLGYDKGEMIEQTYVDLKGDSAGKNVWLVEYF